MAGPAERVCTLSTHGVGVDANGNGILDDYGYVQACSWADTLGGRALQVSDREEYSQFDSMAPVPDRRLLTRYAYSEVFTDGAGYDSEYSYTSTQRLIHTADRGELWATDRYVNRVVALGVEAAEIHGTRSHWTFLPDAPMVVGGTLPDGALSGEGEVYFFSGDSARHSASFRTVQPLLYQASCWSGATPPGLPFAGGVIEGVISAAPEAGTVQVVQHTCNTSPELWWRPGVDE